MWECFLGSHERHWSEPPSDVEPGQPMPQVTFDLADGELRIRLGGLPADVTYQTFLFMGLFLQQLSHNRIQAIGQAVVAEMKSHEAGVRNGGMAGEEVGLTAWRPVE